MVVVFLLKKVSQLLSLDKIAMENGNRMIRLGAGQNKGRWFLRLDLWRSGWRLTGNRANLNHKIKDADMRNFFPALESQAPPAKPFDPSTPYVFLGGTINGSSWRDKLVEKLHVNYFNPVVPQWSPEARKAELAAKADASVLLYAITPKQEGFYTIAEMTHAVFGLLTRKVFILVLEEDDGETFSEHQRDSVASIQELLYQRMDVTISTDIETAANWLNKELAVQEAPSGD
jgi:hypothetical protein